MGRKSPESLRLLQGQFYSYSPPYWKRELLALEAWCKDTSSHCGFYLSSVPRSAKISCKGSESKHFRLLTHLVFVTAATQLCWWGIKAAIDTTEKIGQVCHLIKCHLRKQAGRPDLACGQQSAELRSVFLTSMTEAISQTPPILTDSSVKSQSRAWVRCLTATVFAAWTHTRPYTHAHTHMCAHVADIPTLDSVSG